MRDVVVAQTQNNQALIDKGLAAGEQVVVDGQYRLQAGSKVEAANQDAPAAAAAPDADGAKGERQGHRGEHAGEHKGGHRERDKSGADPA
jgi:multidrug efflux system membrane fusion protein